jgi:hypothetical protein
MNVFIKAKKAKFEIDDLRNESPSYNLWSSISSQLDFILDDFDASGEFKNKAAIERVKQIIIGVQAVREIEPEVNK